MSTNRMTEGSIPKQMLAFAVPVFLGQLFQQLYNTADSLIVGNLLGSQALAAVSSSGNLIFLMIGFFNGMAMGAGTIIARYFGAQDQDNLSQSIATTFTLSLLIGVLLTIIGPLLAPVLLRWMQTPADVMENSVTYFKIYFSGSLGFIVYNFLAGILRAVGNSRTPLCFLIFSSILNVGLDLLLIAVFQRGVAGAAEATILSQFLSAVLLLLYMMHSKEVYRIDLKKLRLHPRAAREVFRYGLPTGVQNSIISLANVVVQSQINIFGVYAMAGCGAYSKLEGFAFLPIMSFNMAISTFVSQNIGARKQERTRKGARFGILCSVVLAEIIGVIFLLCSRPLISLFDANPQSIEYGSMRAMICGPFFFLLAYSHAVSSVLRGAGKPAVPMYVMMICWCVIRVGFLMITSWFWHDFRFVCWVYPLTWVLSSVFFALYYRYADWMQIPLEGSVSVQLSSEQV